MKSLEEKIDEILTAIGRVEGRLPSIETTQKQHDKRLSSLERFQSGLMGVIGFIGFSIGAIISWFRGGHSS